MSSEPSEPTVFNVLRREALAVRDSRYGSVGELFSGHGVEAVWVSKRGEEIDPGWFSQETVDLLLVVQGQLRVEFADPALAARTLVPGDLLVLPPATKCRAYRWPRDAEDATVFVAFYPLPGAKAKSAHAR